MFTRLHLPPGRLAALPWQRALVDDATNDWVSHDISFRFPLSFLIHRVDNTPREDIESARVSCR